MPRRQSSSEHGSSGGSPDEDGGADAATLATRQSSRNSTKRRTRRGGRVQKRPLFPEDDSLQQAWRERAKKFSLTQSGFCSFVNIDKGNFSKWLNMRIQGGWIRQTVLDFLAKDDETIEAELAALPAAGRARGGGGGGGGGKGSAAATTTQTRRGAEANKEEQATARAERATSRSSGSTAEARANRRKRRRADSNTSGNPSPADRVLLCAGCNKSNARKRMGICDSCGQAAHLSCIAMTVVAGGTRVCELCLLGTGMRKSAKPDAKRFRTEAHAVGTTIASHREYGISDLAPRPIDHVMDMDADGGGVDPNGGRTIKNKGRHDPNPAQDGFQAPSQSSGNPNTIRMTHTATSRPNSDSSGSYEVDALGRTHFHVTMTASTRGGTNASASSRRQSFDGGMRQFFSRRGGGGSSSGVSDSPLPPSTFAIGGTTNGRSRSVSPEMSPMLRGLTVADSTFVNGMHVVPPPAPVTVAPNRFFRPAMGGVGGGLGSGFSSNGSSRRGSNASIMMGPRGGAIPTSDLLGMTQARLASLSQERSMTAAAAAAAINGGYEADGGGSGLTSPQFPLSPQFRGLDSWVVAAAAAAAGNGASPLGPQPQHADVMNQMMLGSGGGGMRRDVLQLHQFRPTVPAGGPGWGFGSSRGNSRNGSRAPSAIGSPIMSGLASQISPLGGTGGMHGQVSPMGDGGLPGPIGGDHAGFALPPSAYSAGVGAGGGVSRSLSASNNNLGDAVGADDDGAVASMNMIWTGGAQRGAADGQHQQTFVRGNGGANGGANGGW